MYEDTLERLARASRDAEHEADEALMQLADFTISADERIRLRSVHLRETQKASDFREIVSRAVASRGRLRQRCSDPVCSG